VLQSVTEVIVSSFFLSSLFSLTSSTCSF